MKCILIKDGKGPVENLYIGEEATPEPKQGEILVKVRGHVLYLGITQLTGSDQGRHYL